MKELLIEIEKELRENRDCVLVVIVRSTGSTPRKKGAMMLVGRMGMLAGTVGGGNLEFQCITKAQRLCGTKEGQIETYVLDNTKAEALGMICGGTTEILFLPIRGEHHLEMVLDGLDVIDKKVGGNLAFELNKKEMFLENTSTSNCDKYLAASYVLRIPLVSQERIIVIGAGHVARELCRLLEYLEFRYIIVDDRAEFATRERFAQAEEILITPLEHIQKVMENTLRYPINKTDGICIMTRGHAGDTDALRYALNTHAGYIGVMGSVRKREKVFSLLEKEGFGDIRNRVITPIGLDIGAQTPEELAVSIAGELIKWRSRKG